MIVIPVLKQENDKYKQVLKVNEESGEILESILQNQSVEEQLSECFDVIQSTIGLMNMIADGKQIEIAATEHYEKLRSRGWEFERILEIKESD